MDRLHSTDFGGNTAAIGAANCHAALRGAAVFFTRMWTDDVACADAQAEAILASYAAAAVEVRLAA